MDFNKKRKVDENGNVATTATTVLSPQDIRKILEPFTKDQLLDILQIATLHHPDLLEAVRGVADGDSSLRKLFIRGLSSETTSDTLRSIFSSYGDLEEAIVIFDKNTGKSKGYGFVTFKHVDGAVIALKEPSKKIDGRMTVTQLASAGVSNSGGGSDVAARKVYVGNVPYEIPSERLLGFFLMYGEIEEGPLGFDKSTGKSKGFAFIIYKTEEGAKAAIAEPMKNIDGHQVICKLAVDNKKVKAQGPGGGLIGDGVHAPPPVQPQSSMPMSQYGGPGNMPPYGGFSGLGNGNYGLSSSLPGAVGGGGGFGGPYGVSQYGGPGSAEFAGLGNAGGSMYRMPPSSIGMPSGGFPDSGPYGVSQQQPPSLPPRVPPGGMFQNPSYF